MFKKIFDVTTDNKLKIMVYKDKVDIINYKEILVFEDNKIIVDCPDIRLKILGSNLIINKLEDNEVLVIGTIKSIELG